MTLFLDQSTSSGLSVLRWPAIQGSLQTEAIQTATIPPRPNNLFLLDCNGHNP